MATYIQTGVYLDHTPGSALAQGGVVAIEDDFYGVATAAIAAGVKGALAVQGVFEFVSDGAIAAGALVFWNSVTSTVSATPAPKCYIGRAVAAAASDKCRVALNASNIGEYTPIVPGSKPTVTQTTIDNFTAAAPTVVDPTTDGIDNADWATADSLVVAAIVANNTAIKAVQTEVVKIVADLGTIKTALNAGKDDLAAVVAQLEAALVLEGA